MPTRFSALKTDDNPFKKESAKKKKPVKNPDAASTGDIFKARPRQPRRAKQQSQPGGSDIFASKANETRQREPEFKLEEVAFPELTSKATTTVPKKPSIKLNFGGTLHREQSLGSKSNNGVARKSGVNINSSERGKLSLKITNLIIKRMEERECKMRYMAWYNNWQSDRNHRIEQGETFYEPYNLEELDDDIDSDSDDYEMEETEYWGAGRGKGGRPYEN